ncbi:MAG: hypothetical protein IKY97_03710 [Mailhella sp.]|nr:hypothetical protein [Mailhella sp.]
MSTDVTSLSGYDAQKYEELQVQYTEQTGKTSADFDRYASSIITEGMTFEEFENKVSAEIPTLDPPIYEQDFSLYVSTAPASFGSTYLALIQDLASDQRRQNADTKALETEALISNIEEQADNIRTKAALDLTASVISGAAQIACGAVSIGMGSAALKGGAGDSALLVKNTQIQGVTGAITGAGSIASGSFTYGGTMVEASNKDLEADAERIRSTQDQLDRIDDALKDLLQQARSSQQTIQQNMNQTRAKILG